MVRTLSHSGHKEAFRRWFQKAETARKQAGLSPGRLPRGYPKPPTSPDELRRLLHEAAEIVGEARALQYLRVHRTTLGRWLSGEVQAPAAAVLVLRLLADGLHPAASDEWDGFRFDGDRLRLPDGRAYTAREIQGWHWQETYIKALESKTHHLERQLKHLVTLNHSGAANDAVRMTGI